MAIYMYITYTSVDALLTETLTLNITAMRFFTTLAVLSVVLCFLMAPCASGNEIIAQTEDESTVLVAVPRTKFAMARKLKSFAHEPFVTHKKSTQHVILKGKKQLLENGHKKEENVLHGSAGKGTWREWMDQGPNKSEYLTMDYGWVKRRRPIHNKQLPYTP